MLSKFYNRGLGTLMLLLGSLLLMEPAAAQGLGKSGKAFPILDLPTGAKGSSIPTVLGLNKHAIADWYGQSDNDFDTLCNRDKTLSMDKKGRLHYVCASLTVQAGSTSAWGTTGATL